MAAYTGTKHTHATHSPSIPRNSTKDNFAPLLVESYGRQCTATHTLLNELGHLAADSGRVTKGA